MTAPRRPLPPELQAELSQHASGHELAQLWDLLAIADPVSGAPEAEQGWAHISATIAREQSPRRPIVGTPARNTALGSTPAAAGRSVRLDTPPRPLVALPRVWQRTAFAIAATLAVLVGSAAWASRPIVVDAPLGTQQVVALPDGSVVELNAGSTLRYRAGLRGRFAVQASRRDVVLDGEAFFDVVPGAKPFEVRTREARVTVLGTRFLVRARSEELEGTQVAVESGRVRVTPQGAPRDSAVVLLAGQGTVVGRGGTTPAPVASVGVERLTLWRRGGFALIDQPLDAIVRELERRYALDIRLNGVPVGMERLSVYYPDRPSIETVLSDLCTPRALRFSRTSRGYEISPSVESPLPTP
jgi:transmembrane sensor